MLHTYTPQHTTIRRLARQHVRYTSPIYLQLLSLGGFSLSGNNDSAEDVVPELRGHAEPIVGLFVVVNRVVRAQAADVLERGLFRAVVEVKVDHIVDGEPEEDTTEQRQQWLRGDEHVEQTVRGGGQNDEQSWRHGES